MSAMIPFSADTQLPAYIRNREGRSNVNKDVATGAQYPTLSIKGKIFRVSQDNETKVLTREVDGEIEPVQKLSVVPIRANKNARVLYLKEYVDGDEGAAARPDCQTMDGIAPTADSVAPQAAKCAICPHAVWGSGREGEGTKCSVVTRLAIADPESLKPMLLRVPAGSRKNFADAVKKGDKRGLDYNMLVMRIKFDPEAPSPKLQFDPVGLLSDESYGKVQELYDSELVREMLGLDAPNMLQRPALPAPAVAPDELDAALAARDATRAAQARPAAPKAPSDDESEEDAIAGFGAVPHTTPPVKAAPVKVKPATPAAAPVKVKTVDTGGDMSNLMSQLDGLLDATDD